MNKLEIFKSDEFGSVRVVEINNEPWFVGKDVAEALGYGKGSNKSKALSNAIKDHVDEDDKQLLSYENFKVYQNGDLKDISHYGAYIINESGVYALVFGSKLESAKRFKHWVTSEVLPTIRKHGMYATPQTMEQMIADPDFAIRLLTELKEERQKNVELAADNRIKHQQILEMTPKAEYYDEILKTKNAIPTNVIAKDYGMSSCEFNKKLHDLKIQYKMGKRWFLYAKYQNKGYTKTETYVTKNNNARTWMKWTQAGRVFLYNMLKEAGILPVIEAVQLV